MNWIIDFRKPYYRLKTLSAGVMFISMTASCMSKTHGEIEENTNQHSEISKEIMSGKTDTITLGAGCFWCVEAIFEELKGVISAESGYSGGQLPNPTYKQVCAGNTGHAEVCQLVYDPSVITLEEILEVFFKTHDPTTLNRQGADVGSQYRSAIFYHNEDQKAKSERIKNDLNREKVWPDPIVTEITAFTNFFVAEDYHQAYFENNAEQPYCRAVIQPKLEKFRKIFSQKLD